MLNALLRQLLKIALGQRSWNKLENLMKARNDDSVIKILRNLWSVVPSSIKPTHAIPKHTFDRLEHVSREHNYVAVHLKDGTVLRAFPSRQQYRNYYYCFRDMLPEIITPESFQPVYDIKFRYDRGDDMIHKLESIGLFEASKSASIVECGAYIGWKALGFAKHVGVEGKLVVLEIDDDQFKLCETNLKSNLSAERFIAMHTGVWNTEEEREYSFEHYASHSLKTPDEHSFQTQTKVTRTDTLDNIIEKCGLDSVDFLNVQTNGSEFNSVDGLSRNLDRVKLMWVGSHYVHDGVSVRWRCIENLLNKGCRIYFDSVNRQNLDKIFEVTNITDVKKSDTGGFWAVSPRHKDRLVPRNLG